MPQPTEMGFRVLGFQGLKSLTSDLVSDPPCCRRFQVFILTFLTLFTLYSTIIPISLYVSIEVCATPHIRCLPIRFLDSCFNVKCRIF